MSGSERRALAVIGQQDLAPAAFARYGARFLVRGGAAEVPEGTADQCHITIVYADLATARACYDSAAYRKARLQRAGASIAQIMIVGGL